jgi:D-xylose 1-dehydrogenase (NADP+, D-xylono-1,5-lactone-forming)
MAQLRIGVLGAANIAQVIVIPSILACEGVELTAIGSNSDRAARFLEGTDLRTSQGQPLREAVRILSYDELLADPDIDAVYIGLPNHLHAEWSKRSADAGKHVLCEKPAARTGAEAEEAIGYCVDHGVIWMEAFMYRFHPQWRSVRERLAAGAIGDLRCIRSVFTFTVEDPQNIRRRPEVGGGSLYDVGSYCVNVSRWMAGRSPVAVSGQQQLSPQGIDEEFQGMLDFGAGVSALIFSSLSQPYRHEVELLGTAGRIVVPSAFVNGSDPLCVIFEDADGQRERIEVEGDDEYRLEVEDFARCVAAGRQPEVVSHEDTLANMATIDALYESARTHRAVEL